MCFYLKVIFLTLRDRVIFATFSLNFHMDVGARGFSSAVSGVGPYCDPMSVMTQFVAFTALAGRPEAKRSISIRRAREKASWIQVYSMNALAFKTLTGFGDQLAVVNRIFPASRVSSRDGTPRADCWLVLKPICILGLCCNVNKTA